jgi:predicted MFS family arabinose efflux permease
MIMTETLPAGLLPQIAHGLDVSEGAAGQLVAAYALGTVLAALPLVAATRGFARKPLLLAGIAGFVVANGVTAVSPAYALTLVARAVAGACSGLLWGLTPGYARRIVPPALAGRGLAVAGVGTPLALALGTPAGSFAGTLLGWRWVFGAMSLAGLALTLWVLLVVPPAAGERDRRDPVRAVTAVLARPGVRPVLVVVGVWMLAHNLLYTYLAPFLAVRAPGLRVDAALLLFGVAALVGIGVTGVLIDALLRRLTVASLAVFAAAALALGLTGGTVPVVLAVLAWGLAFGGASALVNTAVADAATPETDVAATLVSTVWNGSIFGGSVLGALVLAQDAGGLAWVALPLVAAALVVVLLARRHAFRPGRRALG